MNSAEGGGRGGRAAKRESGASPRVRTAAAAHSGLRCAAAQEPESFGYSPATKPNER